MSDIKNIAMVSTHGYFDPIPQLGRTDTGGQVVYVLEVSKALVRMGIEVDIYTRWFERDKNQIEPHPEVEEVRVIRIPAGGWEFIPKEQIYDVLPELSDNMIDFIGDNSLNYDLFHGHYVDGGIVAIEVAERLAKPSFFTAHSLGAWKREQMGGDPEEMERRFNFKKRISEEKRIFNSVNAQAVTTPLQSEKLEELYGFEGDNVGLLPPGVDIHHFRPLVADDVEVDSGLPDEYIFCLSRIDTNKGHDFLLYAFDVVQSEMPDVQLIIGGGSPEPGPRERRVFEMMRKIISERDMEDRVTITGYIPDDELLTYYRQAEVFVLPSLYEPFGMTVLEAMACGTPVVASKFGGIRTVINSGENGILVDTSKPEEFAEATMKLLNDDKLREDMRDSALKTIEEEYSWEAIARRHLKFYEEYM